jgi:argininosuccinate lyase
MNPSDTPAAWSGRFAEPVDERVKRFTASIPFDWRLAPFDIQGSLAHAAMLHRIGVLTDQDLADIRRGLGEILADYEAGRDRKSTRLNSSHNPASRMPSSA